ncbi:SDR family NAD(P)-dependent oxidoreductase [Paludisphaera mucosa]|uniref:SDR family NAD(P)-dependent oxidoreductase n=1 Tax=Paludisphaera mucosa TaxID=3030827 RepID=A0ABT6FEU4_9BACT|nr:SDR family NAD(P)-dependent oxidoreductase [Paludisphaera mucosa]MDG3006091.1 SDR family NAD(P)-dependent oxidoreductase [Paludisphaera mucosa]
MSRRLEGQTAWISGAASGIGEAAARLFAAEGANVALVDIDRERAEFVRRAIAEAGGRALVSTADASSEAAVRDSIERAVAEFGGLSILVNCAGIVHVGLLHEYDEADWDRLMGVNLKSIFFSVKHGLPHLRRASRSYVVNVGSISSFVGQAATPAYTASKSAVLGLSRSIALDYASIGLRCNCVCPGITDTPMLRHHLGKNADPEAALANRLRRVPMNVALTPDDVARSVLYFSCEDSAGVTGTSLVVDGGYLAAAEWNSA